MARKATSGSPEHSCDKYNVNNLETDLCERSCYRTSMETQALLSQPPHVEQIVAEMCDLFHLNAVHVHIYKKLMQIGRAYSFKCPVTRVPQTFPPLQESMLKPQFAIVMKSMDQQSNTSCL